MEGGAARCEKFTCRECERISQTPAPFHALPRSFAGPSLLAMILFEKYGQHQPLNRQSERYTREGIDLSVSTLADQVGGCAALLRPIYELIHAHVFAGARVHGDETTVPVLAKHQCRKGRLWTYVRDDKPFAGPAPPAAVFFYSRDRTAEHPERHLAGYAGILQADAYAGFNRSTMQTASQGRSSRPAAGRMAGASSSSLPMLPPRRAGRCRFWRRSRSRQSSTSTRSSTSSARSTAARSRSALRYAASA